MTSPIRRVGLVAKPGLTEAADLLGEIGAWLVVARHRAVLRGRDGGARRARRCPAASARRDTSDATSS